MGFFILAVYLILIGFMGLVQTNVPSWVPAAVALVAGLALLFIGFRDYRKT